MEGTIHIDRRIMNKASHYIRNRTPKSDASMLSWLQVQKASYPLPINLLSKDFDHVLDIPCKSKTENSLNRVSGSAERGTSELWKKWMCDSFAIIWESAGIKRKHRGSIEPSYHGCVLSLLWWSILSRESCLHTLHIAFLMLQLLLHGLRIYSVAYHAKDR